MARAFLLSAAIAVFAAPVFADERDQSLARDDRIEELERKVDILVEELSSLRTQVAVPDDPSLKSQYGFGPAASKIYGIERGLSIGGYGEAFYTNFIGDEEAGSGLLVSDRELDRADFLRLVLYLGYKFTDRILFNAEIEFEHASIGGSTSSAGSGSVSVEFAALDFFLNDHLNARAGMLLLPMGFLNEIHEPPFFHGVQRPETERRIIPSTWRENGVGIFGRLNETLEYRAYVVTGFNARGFSDSGIRSGRQQGNRALAEDLAYVVRLDWTPTPGLLLGGSFYKGDSGQDQEVLVGGIETDVPDASLTIGEIHAQYRRGPLHARGLFAVSFLSDARDLNLALGRAQNRPIADKMLGGYAEVAYDIWPMLFGDAEKSLSPFLRVEYVDTQYEVPTGFIPNRRNAYFLYTPGITFKPHPNVALKLEYRNFNTRGEPRPDELSIGMGFAF